MHRRTASLALLSGLLAGCAGFDAPRTVTLGETELNALIDRQFPRQQRLLDLVDVEVSRPRLKLLPERNRLAATVSVTARDRLSLTRQVGVLSFDTALRLETADQTVRLTQVAVQSLTFEGLAADNLALRLGRALSAQLLDDLPIYRPDAERLAQLRRAGRVPGAVTVTARGVEITLADAAR